MPFWKDQPIGQNKDNFVNITELDPDQIKDNIYDGQTPENIKSYTKEELEKYPDPLPEGFFFESLDISSEKEWDNLVVFLKSNYIADETETFVVIYDKNFLKSSLLVPGFSSELFVLMKYKKKIVGFIAGIPRSLICGDIQKTFIIVNFLSVLKKLRNKNMASSLIKEITRRVGCLGLFQAIFTNAKPRTECFTETKYWDRFIDVKKVLDFSQTIVNPKNAMATLIRKTRIFEKDPQNYIRLNSLNYDQYESEILIFLQNKLKPFYLKLNLDQEEIKLYKEKIITNKSYIKNIFLGTTFIEESDQNLESNSNIQTYIQIKDDKVVELLNFYILEIENSKTNAIIKQSWIQYMFTDLEPRYMISNCLYFIKQSGSISVACIEMMNMKELLEIGKFNPSSNKLFYSFYNWQNIKLKPNKIAIHIA